MDAKYKVANVGTMLAETPNDHGTTIVHYTVVELTPVELPYSGTIKLVFPADMEHKFDEKKNFVVSFK
jgi:hypothetical protein